MKRLLCWILSLCLLLCLVPGAAAAERMTGTLERRAGYDLASVRCELADGSYFFASVEETAAGYAYAFDCPAGTYTVKPEYFSTTVWDGAVDISWYDASQTVFSIDTPAKLAGLAALVNGQVDVGTPDYRIKGDRSELVSTRVDDYLLVGAGGGSQYGTAYVGDAAHDFSDKTVYLTADLDMGGSSNWTPIGGLYPMDRDNTERVIVAYFNGTLDGQGHRITNLFCDRYAEKGYAYSQGVGLIGHMGDIYDDEAAPETAPAVRNLSVSGSIYGRRMVGGIVGRTGSIPTGIYLENCANHASVKNTDSKGVGGIVGAGWSKGAIVNCYNTGSVTTGYACPAGGICGSNSGLDIYNCYNAGVIDSNGSHRGRAIGGHNNGSYTVSDCYYLEGCDDDPASNGWYSGTALSCVVSVTAMPKADMRSQKLVDALNCNGAAYAAVQGSYPVLAWEAERSPATHTVRITQPEGGTVASDGGESVAFGTVLHLSNTPDIGWAFRTYTLNGETLTGPYATVTADAAVSGVFSRMTAGALYIENAPAFPITVKKDGTVMENGTARRVTDYPVADGDPLYEGDILTATATLAEGAEPEDLSYVYNGKFRYYFTFQDAAQTEKSTDTGKFTVTSRITSASLRLRATAYTTHKVWTQLAETDWYTPSADRFTLTSARQLAGLAQLVKQGNSFAGKTVLLGADISLANDDKTFNRGVRWFDGIGSTQAPFAGTFDGNGYRITEMTAETTGSGAALFLAADGAVLKNIRGHRRRGRAHRRQPAPLRKLWGRHRKRVVSGRRGRCVHDGGRVVTHRLLQRRRGAQCPYLCLLRHGRPDRLRKRLPRRKLLQLRRGQRGGRNGGWPDRPGQQPFDKRARKSLLPRGFLRYRRRRQDGGIGHGGAHGGRIRCAVLPAAAGQKRLLHAGKRSLSGAFRLCALRPSGDGAARRPRGHLHGGGLHRRHGL